MDDAIMPVVQIVPVLTLAAFGVLYASAQFDAARSDRSVAKITPSIRDRPSLLQESFTGFCELTWFVVALMYGLSALLRWLAGEPDIAAGLVRRAPIAGSIYGYIALAYLARDIWRVRKPLGALLTGRGDWVSVKAAYASAYITRSTPGAA